jgi:hypothetical protein
MECTATENAPTYACLRDVSDPYPDLDSRVDGTCTTT